MRVLLVLAVATAQFCFPPSCRIDANCYDSINNKYAKCCGGKCVDPSSLPVRLGGESCDVSGSYESCRGSCAEGLYCSSVDEKCHSQTTLCNCTLNNECVSGYCTTAFVNSTQKACRPYSYTLNLGLGCNSNTQCRTSICNNVTNRCDYPPIGTSCFSNSCGPNAFCDTLLTYRCTALCASNVSGCCVNDGSCANHTETCSSSTRTCTPPPGLGENCTSRCNSSAVVCSYACNGTACILPKFCQSPNLLALGDVCSVSEQCPVNASCYYNASTGVFVCIGDVPLGGECFTASNCRAPGTICSYNNNTKICKAVGGTPIGALCDSATPLECVNGSQCASNGSAFICAALLALGDNCTTGGVSCNNSGVCVPPTITGSCTIASQGCTCAASNSVADGGACTSSLQCGPSSACLNGNCTSMAGKSCNSTSDCISSKFRCNCNRQCYVLPPTPLLAPTPAPTTCKAETDAAQYLGFQWVSGTVGLVSSTVSAYLTGSNAFVSQVMALNLDQQRAVITLACCVTCPLNQRFNSLGFQVDCTNKTLVVLPLDCNRTELAFLDCWKTVTSSATASSGVGLVAMLVAAGFLL